MSPLSWLRYSSPGTAAGVAETKEVEETGDGDVAEDVVPEHLHQVEDEIGLAAGESADEPLDVAVDAEHGDTVAEPAEGPARPGGRRGRTLSSFRLRCRGRSER